MDCVCQTPSYEGGMVMNTGKTHFCDWYMQKNHLARQKSAKITVIKPGVGDVNRPDVT